MIEQARSLVTAVDKLKRAKDRLSNFQQAREQFVRWTNPSGSGSGYDSVPMTPEIGEIVAASLTADIASAELAVTAATQALQDAAKGDQA